MNRRVATTAAALLALVVAASPLTSAGGYTRYNTTTTVQQKVLSVTTIAEDDEVRQKGIIVLGLEPPYGGWPLPSAPGSDSLAQYKILVTLDGVPITWRIGDPGMIITCQVIEKDKVVPAKSQQFGAEQVRTVVTDVSGDFVCKPRWTSSAPGYLMSAGVLDVYYVGPQNAFWIGDNVLVVSAIIRTTVGKATLVAYGAEIQDICLLGWSMSNWFQRIPLPGGDGGYFIWTDPLGDFVSCEDAALLQRQYQGIPIPPDYSGGSI